MSIGVVGGIIREGEKLLLVKNRGGVRTLPGGKIDNNETRLEALHREIKEEIAGIKIHTNRTQFYKSFLNLTSPQGDMIDIHTFNVNISILSILKSSGETTDAGYYKIPEILSSSSMKDATRTILLDLSKKD